MVIGVTGQIGAGKTTAARMLAKLLGGVIVDADRIGREVVDGNVAALRKLARRFGSDILDSSGQLNRKKLARRAFASDESRDALNSIVHPYLLKELRKQMRDKERAGRIVIIDAALLLDWGLDAEIDATLAIHASRELRLMRLAARGIDRRDALARMKRQLPYAEYRRRAGRLILNSRTSESLQKKIVAFAQKLTGNSRGTG